MDQWTTKLSLPSDATALQGLALPDDPDLKSFRDVMEKLFAMMNTGEMGPSSSGQPHNEKEKLSIPFMDMHFWTKWKEILDTTLVASGCVILT